MAKIKARIKTDRDMTSKSSGGGGVPTKYQLIPPGRYPARVNSFECSSFKTKAGHEMFKLIPQVRVLNENMTEISRQDFIVGYIDEDGCIFRPDGDDEKPSVWTGYAGASFMLEAMDMYYQDEETGEWVLDLETDGLLDRVVIVVIATGGYIKRKGNFDPETITKMLKSVNDDSDYTFEEIPKLVEQWNIENDYIDEDGEYAEQGVALRLKNVIAGWYGMKEDEAEEAGYPVDDYGRVFFDEIAMNLTLDREEQEESDEPEWGSDEEGY